MPLFAIFGSGSRPPNIGTHPTTEDCRGRRGAFLFHDAVNGRLRARPAARLAALQNGGTIPDQFDYEVVLMPQGHRIGTLGEDFAFESSPGDIFQLGNTSYRILRTDQGRVLVEDAAGQPPTIPFWFGDRPGRSDGPTHQGESRCP